MSSIVDQIGNPIKLNSIPRRIISLVPSITEYLHDLNLEEQVVGVTKFCVHPAHWLKEKEIIGGTKQQHLTKIRELKPDLVIASKEENVKSYVETLSKTCPVYVSDVTDLSSAIEMMKDLGILTGRIEISEKVIDKITTEFESLHPPVSEIKVAYCIWKSPWMWAGSDSFISEMLNMAGFENIVSSNRYPEIEMIEILENKPDYVFLSSEPFPFQEKHIEELKYKFPNGRFIVVDGEMFSWYGSRMLQAPTYFRSLINKLKSEEL